MRANQQKGFSVVFLVAILLVVTGVCLAGIYVWQKNNNADIDKRSAEPAAPLQKQREDSKPPQKTISLLNGTVDFTDDGTWKVATGGYYSVERGCGQTVNSDEDCLDHKMLIPADETFTNPDQFQVNISVFKVDGVTSSNMLGQWVDQNVAPGGSDPEKSYSKINGNDAYRYEVSYGKDEVRLVYGVLIENNIVVIQSNFFRGDYYSYMSSTDYMPLITKVENLVETIR